MQVNLIKYCCWLVIALFLSCSKAKQEMNPVALIQHVESENNGFQIAKEINGVLFKSRFEPAEYACAKQIVGNNIKGLKAVAEYLESRSGLDYYSLEIENIKGNTDPLMIGIQSQQEYLARVDYFSYEFEQDVFLASNTDTLRCALFHYENSYGGMPKLRFLFAFPKSNTGRTLIINDRIFKNGLVKLSFEKELFVPRLTDLN